MELTTLVRVSMVREQLEDLPCFPVPSPFTIRYHAPGDIATWLAIQQAADQYQAVDPALFARAFGTDEAALRERQCFLCDGAGQAVGTATAWFNDDYHGRACGRVHWLAVIPSLQGKGLGKALMSEVCRRLRALHHTRAYLVTHTVRLPAIRLYLTFGFVPEIRVAEDLAAWREVEGQGLTLPQLGSPKPPGPEHGVAPRTSQDR
jgi:GNAT superfamily N-acetyltransferase